MALADDILLAKAEAALLGAESEFAAGRYDNVANRCYYACFQAAVAALEAVGIRPSGGPKARWTHAGVEAQFVGLLINRRKRYPGRLRNVLPRLFLIRQQADYTRERVSEAEARLALRRSRDFLAAIQNDREDDP
ncbi:MAG: HEPN domain-containing protein [Chloroflexia bacterium]|nr:HEPN domain-containing protein [Chloroflexia bacterium]